MVHFEGWCYLSTSISIPYPIFLQMPCCVHWKMPHQFRNHQNGSKIGWTAKSDCHYKTCFHTIELLSFIIYVDCSCLFSCSWELIQVNFFYLLPLYQFFLKLTPLIADFLFLLNFHVLFKSESFCQCTLFKFFSNAIFLPVILILIFFAL